MAQGDDEHIIEAIGRSRIVIKNGKVVEVGEALISDCPLAKRFGYPIPAIARETVRMNIEHRIPKAQVSNDEGCQEIVWVGGSLSFNEYLWHKFAGHEPCFWLLNKGVYSVWWVLYHIMC